MNFARLLSPCWIETPGNPDELRAHTSEPLFRLVCLGFFIAGCFVLSAAVYACCRRPVNPIELALGTLIGAAFFFFGGIIAFGATGFSIDRGTRRLVVWRTFAGFRSEECYSFDDLERIVAVRCWYTSGKYGNGRTPGYKILVERKTSADEPIELADRVGSARSSRRILRSCGNIMNIPVGFRDEIGRSRASRGYLSADI